MIRTFVVEQETALDGRGAIRARQRPIHMQTRLQQHSLPRYIECMYFVQNNFPHGTRKSKEEEPSLLSWNWLHSRQFASYIRKALNATQGEERLREG
jgi:hypothetical protein